MTDTKISGLTAVTVTARTDEVPVNQGGTTKKVTLAKARGHGWYVATDSDYGAVGDGSTDDTTGINAAITAASNAGGGTVYFPYTSGGYVCLNVALKSNVRLLGDSGAFLVAKSGAIDGDHIVAATGTTGTTVSLNANAILGATTVTAATNPASLVAGNYVLIRDATYAYGTSGRNQELNRIVSVSGAGPYTFTVASRLLGSYATASTAEILKLNAVINTRVESLSFSVPASNLSGGVGLTLCYDADVDNCYFTGTNQRPAVDINQSAHVQVTDTEVRDCQQVSGNYGYGFLVGSSSHDVLVSGCYTENIRENPITDGSKIVSFVANVCRSSYDDGVNAHGTGNGRILIANNIVSGSGGYGINVGFTADNHPDIDVMVVNNYIEDTAGSAGISVDTAVGGTEQYVLVTGNTIRRHQGSSAAGIYLGAHAANVLVAGNMVDGGGLANSQYGIQINGATDCLVSGNIINNIGNGYGVVVGASTRCSIQGNSIAGVSSNNVYSLGTNTGLVVTGNRADDTTYVSSAGEWWYGNMWNTTPDAQMYIGQGTLLATAVAGTLEMDVNALYATTDAGNRGVIPVRHIIRADATRTFTSNILSQAIFTSPTNGRLTLETGMYVMRGLLNFNTMSATSGNLLFSILGAGTATLGAQLLATYGIDGANATAAAISGSVSIATASPASAVTASTGTVLSLVVDATFEVTGAGSIIPSITQVTASAAVLDIGSYLAVERMGSTSLVSVGQWD